MQISILKKKGIQRGNHHRILVFDATTDLRSYLHLFLGIEALYIFILNLMIKVKSRVVCIEFFLKWHRIEMKRQQQES